MWKSDLYCFEKNHMLTILGWNYGNQELATEFNIDYCRVLLWRLSAGLPVRQVIHSRELQYLSEPDGLVRHTYLAVRILQALAARMYVQENHGNREKRIAVFSVFSWLWEVNRNEISGRNATSSYLGDELTGNASAPYSAPTLRIIVEVTIDTREWNSCDCLRGVFPFKTLSQNDHWYCFKFFLWCKSHNLFSSS